MEKDQCVNGRGPHAKEAPESQYMPLGVKIRQEWLLRKKAELSIISDKIGKALDKIQSGGGGTSGTLKIRTRFKSRDKNYNKVETSGAASTIESRDGCNRIPCQNSDFPQSSSCHVLLTRKKSCESIKPYSNRSRGKVNAKDDCIASGKIYLPKSKETRRPLNYKLKANVSSNKAETKLRSKLSDWRSVAKRRISSDRNHNTSKKKEHRHLADAFMDILSHPIGSQTKKTTAKGNYVEICCEVKDKRAVSKKVKKSSLKNQNPVGQPLKQTEQGHNNYKATNDQVLSIGATKRRRRTTTPAKNASKILPKISSPVEKKNARTQPKSETRNCTSIKKITAPSEVIKTENESDDSKSAHRDMNTQTPSLLENEPDLIMFNSREFLSVTEATRVSATTSKAGSKRARHHKKSRSTNRHRSSMNCATNGLPNSSETEKGKDFSSSLLTKSDISSTSSFMDTIQKNGGEGHDNADDGADGVVDDATEKYVDSFPCHSLSERLQEKLSCIKAKGNLHLSEVGFKNHQTYPVNSVYRHNSLPRTPQQLGVAFMKLRPSYHARVLESFYSDSEGGPKPKEKPGKKGGRRRKKKRRSLSCMSLAGVSEQKSARKGKKKKNQVKLER